MTLQERLKSELGKFDKVDINRDAIDHGRPGISFEFWTGDESLWFFFASDNKMTVEHMITVMKSYLRRNAYA